MEQHITHKIIIKYADIDYIKFDTYIEKIETILYLTKDLDEAFKKSNDRKHTKWQSLRFY